MTCRTYLTDLSGYLDDELDAARRAAVQSHIDECGACRERIAGYRSLKHAVARLEASVRPPEAVYARIEGLRFTRARPRVWRRVALVATFGAAVASGVMIALQVSAPPNRIDTLIADHLRYGPDAMPAEVASAESENVRNFFDGKVPFAPVAPSIPGATLVGGRVCKIDGNHVQLLFYRRPDTTLSLYVSAGAGEHGCGGSREHHACTRNDDSLSYTLVGRLPADAVATILDEIIR